MERRPIVIVGAGPAGTASALFLKQRDPHLASEILVLDKAVHPRHKVCAGGLIPHTLDCLAELEIPFDVPHVRTFNARVGIPDGEVYYRGTDELCRVIRRNEFDYSLVRACRERGIEVRDGERVVEVRRVPRGVRIVTETSEYETPLVVGADGSGSLVRRALLGGRHEHVGKAIMTDVPAADCEWPGFEESRYEFDFTDVPSGLRGYSWAFPCWIGGTRYVNFGAYSVEAAGCADQLQAALLRILERYRASNAKIESFPIRWHEGRGQVAAPNVLLAGDAAGCDPLMGEGISYALEYGRRVAEVAPSLVRGDTSGLRGYHASVNASWFGRKLRRLDLGVRLFYGRNWRRWFRVAAASRKGQEIGIRWYNGVDGMDRDGLAAIRRMFRASE